MREGGVDRPGQACATLATSLARDYLIVVVFILGADLDALAAAVACLSGPAVLRGYVPGSVPDAPEDVKGSSGARE